LWRLDVAIEFHFGIEVASWSLWQRFQRYLLEYRQFGFSLDISRTKFPGDLFEKMRPQIEHASAAMLSWRLAKRVVMGSSDGKVINF
jgi:hypothetical protein